MYGSRVSKDLNLPVQPSAGVRTSVPMSSSGLLRYGSAPSTLVGEVCEDFLPAAGAGAGQCAGSPDHAADTVLARFLADHHQQDGRDKPPAPPTRPAAAASHFAEDASMASQQQQLMYQSQHQQQQMAAVGGLYRTVSSAGMEANGGNSLIRQSSSPAGFLNHLNMDNGYGVMLRAGMGAGRFRNGADAAADSPSGGAGGRRLKGQLSFSSRQGSFMSQISEVGSEELSGSSPEAGGIGRGYLPRYPSASGWEDTSLLSPDSLSGMKRPRDASDSAQFANGLSPQFSLPKTSSEMATIEKFLEFQDAVPCKIRAKRGCATHPRSIAERVRRTRISERIRKLQELVPNMEKQTNTADMLDLAVDYIKDLQKQVKVLSDNRANCTCSASKQKQFSS